MALHGNPRNLLAHQAIARRAGLPAHRVVDLRDGGTLRFADDGALERQDGAPAQEPLAAFGQVEHFPQGIIQSRKRMAAAGVLVVHAHDGVPDVLLRGVSPALSEALELAVRSHARGLLHAAGTEGEADAVRALARLFWRAGRVPPEIVVVP